MQSTARFAEAFLTQEMACNKKPLTPLSKPSHLKKVSTKTKQKGSVKYFKMDYISSKHPSLHYISPYPQKGVAIKAISI